MAELTPGSKFALRERVGHGAEPYRLLVDQIKDYAIFLLTPDGRVATWNEGARRLKRYDDDEIIGQHISRFYIPEDRDRGLAETLLEAARRDGRVEHEGWRVRKDGSLFWADVVITAIRGPAGELVAFGKITRDLTDRREAELALAQSEERFRTLVASVKDYAIFLLSPEGIVTTWNQGARRLKGYEESEIIGRHFQQFYAREDREARLPERLLATALAEGRVESEGWRVRKDGTRFWADVVITAIRAEKTNELMGFAKVTRDLSERKASETQREQLVLDLQSANRELESFAYSVSHDLRAPLRAIDGFSAALLEEYAGVIDGEGQDYLHRLRAATQRMGQLIDDMLRLSRVTRGPLLRERVDLSALAEEIAAQLHRTEPARDVRWQIEPGLVARGDSRLLRLVLENLLGNAFKFTSRTKSAAISFRLELRDGERVFSVADNGAGFDMRYADQLFGAFQRLHGASEFEGTGIGLATVQRIITRHGGRVEAAGVVGEGATFSFTLGREGG